MRTVIIIGAALLATVRFPSALADDNAPSISGPSVALLAGYGVKDGYNVGVGGRVGETLPNRLYLGATFVDHLGRTQTPLPPWPLRVSFFDGSDEAARVPHLSLKVSFPSNGYAASRWNEARSSSEELVTLAAFFLKVERPAAEYVWARLVNA